MMKDVWKLFRLTPSIYGVLGSLSLNPSKQAKKSKKQVCKCWAGWLWARSILKKMRTIKFVLDGQSMDRFLLSRVFASTWIRRYLFSNIS